MKIILISAISKLGKVGDIVEVKDGYGKNFLIPAKKAICYSTANYKVFEEKKAEFEKANQGNLDAANKIKDAISGKNITIIENASDDGRLYGSVNSSVIAAKVSQNIEGSISRSEISLEKPIKEIGIYEALITPHSEVSFKVNLVVSRSESEVKTLLEAKKEAEKKPAKKKEEKTEEKVEAKIEAETETSEESKEDAS